MAAKWAGILFLVAMAVSIAGNLLLLPILGSDDYLQAVAAQPLQVRIAAVLMTINSVTVVGIGALIYWMFRGAHGLLAGSYALARVAEAVTLSFGVISVLTLPSLAEDYAQGAAPHLVSLGNAAIDTNWYAYHAAMIYLGLGSLYFCYVLFRHRLLPRSLAALGFAGYLILALTSLFAMLDWNLGLAVTLPVFLFEVILGVWLIVRGFATGAD